MNGPPRAALDPIIEPPDSPMNWAGFYEFKTMKYKLQSRLISKEVFQKNIFLLRHIFAHKPLLKLIVEGFELIKTWPVHGGIYWFNYEFKC